LFSGAAGGMLNVTIFSWRYHSSGQGAKPWLGGVYNSTLSLIMAKQISSLHNNASSSAIKIFAESHVV